MSAFLYRLGRRCAAHPFRTLGVWLLIVLAVVAANGAAGGDFSDDFRLPGSESQRAKDDLEARFAQEAGASGRIVFHADQRRIDDPAVRSEIASAIQRLSKATDVASVSDPFVPGSAAVSADGHTAFSEVQYRVNETGLAHYREAVRAIEPARQAGVQAEISGSIAEVAREVHSKEAVGLAVAVVVLLVAFGSVIAMGIPIGIAVLGIGVGLSGVGLLAAVLDVPEVSSLLASMVGLGVGIDYALFVVTRHRQHLHDGMSPVEAAGWANATAGQSVLFAGTTVVIAICGLVIAGVPTATALGFAVAVCVVASMALALTALPALLGLVGARIDRLAIHRRTVADGGRQTLSVRWANHVGHRPWPYAVASLAVLVALAAPVLALHTAFPNDHNAPPTSTDRKAYELMAAGFGKGFNARFQVVLEMTSSDRSAVERVGQALAATPGVVELSGPDINDAGDTAVFTVTPSTSSQDPATAKLQRHIRDDVLPVAVRGTGARALVTGGTALEADLSERLAHRLPLFIAVVVGLSFLLLMVLFRSVFVLAKAAVMNLLSIGAAYGVVVALFQWGWASSVIGLHTTVPVNPFLPILMFAILFGLSMDYEVFLLSRVREQYVRTGDSHRSVVGGLGSTARVITSAALVMISVFLAFVPTDDVTAKMFGVGLATAVLLDATLVRMVLVPATMAIAGRVNWWLPRGLDRVLPHVDLDPSVAAPVDHSSSRQQVGVG